MTPAGRHSQSGLEVIALATQDSSGDQAFHGVAQPGQVLKRALRPPRPLRVSTYGFQIVTGDLRELEAPHRSAKNASIWSSLSLV